MSVPLETRIIYQNLTDEDHPRIEVQTLLESNLTEELIDSLFDGAAANRRVGVSPAYTTSGNLTVLAIGTARKVLVIQFHAKRKTEINKTGRELLQDKVLCNPDCTVFAFDLAPLAAEMFYHHRLRLNNAVNIQSACTGGGDTPLDAIGFALGDRATVYKENVTSTFHDLTWDQKRATALALRAWVAHYLPSISDMEEKFRDVKRVNTKDMDDPLLELITQLAHGDQDVAKDDSTTAHEYTPAFSRNNVSKVNATRFPKRFQKADDVRMSVRDKTGAEYVLSGKINEVKGRTADIKSNALLEGKIITSIETINSNRPTNADREKAAALLRVLQGESDLFKNSFLNYMCFSSDSFVWPETWTSDPTTPSIMSARPLNPAQQEAVEHMLTMDNDHRITVIQGPPGTGKTTVIAAFVCSSVASSIGGIWLVAQSNIAVKNIAEKLADVNFMKWKLLVSADFEEGWHEHLYYKISGNVIRSREFKEASRLLQGCSVVLCTLAMLSNPRVKKLTAIVPMRALVVDEASQIALSDYIPPLSNYSTIRKLCFIGDDKQLPPYGQDENEERKSVFEVPHLRSLALFLNTQYRMPPQIGDFISDAVYNGQLQSNPEHPISVSNKTTACYFVDVDKARENPSGTSWLNTLEREAVLKIAARLQEENKNYRIITPYDAQRNALEIDMKKADLSWQNKCFNVDSFQGNEEDYIIISLVRSAQLGFLTDLRRTNVMLSRCKRGMFICSSWDFIFGVGNDSLVGRMANDFGDLAWIGMQHLEDGDYEYQ